MAITNYTNLKSSVASWMHRGDLTSLIEDFIDLAETRINNDLSSRLSEMETTLTATIGSRNIALPSGFMRHYALWLTTYMPRREMVYVVPESIPKDDDNSTPKFYTIIGSNIVFNTTCDIAYTFDFRYKAKYDIATTATNDILTNYPNLYLYASLIEGFSYIEDNDKLEKYSTLYKESLSQVMNTENKSKGLATLRSEMVGMSTSNIYNGGF